MTNLLASMIIHVAYMLHLLTNYGQLRAKLLQRDEVVLERMVNVRDRGRERLRGASLGLLPVFHPTGEMGVWSGKDGTHLETLYDFAKEVVYRPGVAEVLGELALWSPHEKTRPQWVEETALTSRPLICISYCRAR